MKTRTFYNSNPKFAKVKVSLNDLGERESISVFSNSKGNEAETEMFYIYKNGKRRLARRTEKTKTSTTEFLYPVFTGKPMEIHESYHPHGKLISKTIYDENWNEIDFHWIENGKEECYNS